MDHLLRNTRRWFQPDQLTPAEMVKQVALRRFLWGLPSEEQKAGGMKAAWTP